MQSGSEEGTEWKWCGRGDEGERTRSGSEAQIEMRRKLRGNK